MVEYRRKTDRETKDTMWLVSYYQIWWLCLVQHSILLYTMVEKGEATTLQLLAHTTEAIWGRRRQRE